MLGDMETKDWLIVCSCIGTVVAIFWKTIFGGDREMRSWAEKEFVRREIFDLHQDQVAKELTGFREQIVKMHEDNRSDRSTDRALMMEILRAVGGTPPTTRRERPSDPGRR